MTRKLPKTERRDQILDVATELFVERGYEHVSMEAIADSAGITKGGLYHHFRSKEEVLRQANDRFTEPVIGMIERAATNASAADGIRSYIREYVEFWLSHRIELSFVILCMIKAYADPDKWPVYAEYERAMVAALSGVLRGGIASGEFRNHDSDAHALILVGALDGLLGYAAMDVDLTADVIADAAVKVAVEPISLGEVRL